MQKESVEGRAAYNEMTQLGKMKQKEEEQYEIIRWIQLIQTEK